MRYKSAYKRKSYSGPRPSRKKVKAQLKKHYGEGVSRSDVWALRNGQMLSFMKCEKCGTTNESNPELSFYRFPCPNVGGNGLSTVRCKTWAEFCWPDKVLTLEELRNVYKEKQLLCSKHFPDKTSSKRYGLKLGVPTDFLNEEKKKHLVRTYGKKVAVVQKTDTNIESSNLPKQDVPKARKKVKSSKNDLSTEEKRLLDHNFLEGEDPAELFETIDEIFELEDNADVSMYEEPVVNVKPEPCDTVLHEGYNCNLCLSSISGYRYTCVQCDDVDLCAACEAAGAHAAHYVLRVPRPRPEEEVEELVKELRNILKKRPPDDRPRDRPVEKIIIPSKCTPDPLQPPTPPDVGSTEQYQSDDETADSGSENESDPERPDIDNPPPASTHLDSNLEDDLTSRQEEIVALKPRKLRDQEAKPTTSKMPPKRRKMSDQEAKPTTSKMPPKRRKMSDQDAKPTTSKMPPKRRKLSDQEAKPTTSKMPPKRRKMSDQEAKPTTSKMPDKLIVKCSKSDTADETPVENVVLPEKAEKIVNMNKLKEKQNLVLEEALSSESVQQAKAQIEAEVEINRDSIKLEVDDQYGLDVELGENELGGYTGCLHETLDEQPFDYIIQQEDFNEDDPLASGPIKVALNTGHEQVVTVKDDSKCTKRRSKRNKRV
ncbi:uncharacterized protein isoform X2 [Choristoneura fumiferana]|uniref:uncharacterized protein isoform X2 n=1 Tax=Choristoneura fumiferana TaxID=7141 RepID=UPI003D15B691